MDDCSPLSFGRAVRTLRMQAGVLQVDLARRIELPAPYLSDVERGARPAPRETTVRRLAHELNLPPEESATLLELAVHSRQAWKVRVPGSIPSAKHDSVDPNLRHLMLEAERMAQRSGVVIEIRARSMRITIRPAHVQQDGRAVAQRPGIP